MKADIIFIVATLVITVTLSVMAGLSYEPDTITNTEGITQEIESPRFYTEAFQIQPN